MVLGNKISRCRQTHMLSQEKYVKNLIEKRNMQNCQTVSEPVVISKNAADDRNLADRSLLQ